MSYSGVEKWRKKLRNEPEHAGWLIDTARGLGEAFPPGYDICIPIAEALEKPISEIVWHELCPYDVMNALMSEKTRHAYDWDRFEKYRCFGQDSPPSPR